MKHPLVKLINASMQTAYKNIKKSKSRMHANVNIETLELHVIYLLVNKNI
jgi:hypothetical protein